MVFCVEPMVCVGGPAVRLGDDNWAIYSEDGSLTAHFEHTIAVTAEGPRILTPWHLQEDRGRGLSGPPRSIGRSPLLCYHFPVCARVSRGRGIWARRPVSWGRQGNLSNTSDQS